MNSQGDFSRLFRPGLRRDFRDEYEDFETEYDQFLKVGTIDGPEVRGTQIVGPNRLFLRGDGEPVIYEDFKMNTILTYVDQEFAGGFMITRKAVEDDKYGKANQGAKWLARAARLTYEYCGAAVLDDMFTGSTYKTFDGLSIVNSAHVPIGNTSATQANTPTTPVQISIAGISGLLDLWTQLKDENGDPIKEWPDLLVYGVNPGDENTVLAIYNSDLEPFTADHTDNVVRRRTKNMKFVMSHFKASAKSYFLVNQKLNDAHLDIRRAVEFDDTFDFDTHVAKYQASTRFIRYVMDWRGWTGSNPS
jgi:hypothetical protein